MTKTLRSVIFICLFAIPFVPFLISSALFFPFITTKAFAFRILVEIACAAWAVLAIQDRVYRPKKSAIWYALIAFFVIIGIADLFGVAPLKSFWSNYERMEGYIALLHLGAFFIVSGTVFKEVEWHKWWKTSLLASFLMVIYCAFQLAGVLTINQGGVRVDGTLGNAAYLAVYLLFHIFIALFFLYKEKKDRTIAWVYGLLIILQVWILYYTATRGAILGLLGGLFVVALLNIRNREEKLLRRASMGVIALILILGGGFYLIRNSSFVATSPVLSRFASISTEELKSGGRAFVWPMALQGLKEHPLLGWGQDNFNFVFNEHYSAKMYNLEPWFDRAHNIFLDWGVASGLLGLLAYLALYGAALWTVWRKSAHFAYAEKTIITGLLAAYFFHNLFVFDQLVSYFLFMALLGYLSFRSVAPLEHKPAKGKAWALPVIAVALVLLLYFATIKPLRANATLIDALKETQSQDFSAAAKDFQTAYHLSYLGRAETVEQIASNAQPILASTLSTGEKNLYYQFAVDAVTKLADEEPGDARHAMVAGIFFSQVGDQDKAATYFNKALALMPEKQVIYFELGTTLLNAGHYGAGLSAFKKAVDLDPSYEEAQKMYLFSAVYAGDNNLELSLLSTLPEKDVVFDDRLLSAYYAKKRFAAMQMVIERRKALDPANTATYDNLLKQVETLQ
jgi:O-antigen ligase